MLGTSVINTLRAYDDPVITISRYLYLIHVYSTYKRPLITGNRCHRVCNICFFQYITQNQIDKQQSAETNTGIGLNRLMELNIRDLSIVNSIDSSIPCIHKSLY
jgi:hypothetical protein